MAMKKTETKLALFGFAFLFLLAQNVFLVHHKKVADLRVEELEAEVARLQVERSPETTGAAGQPELSNLSR